MNSELELISQRALAAACNGVYQGILLAFAIWLAMKCWPRGNAATRHLIWFGALLLVAALPAAHFILPAAAERRGSPVVLPGAEDLAEERSSAEGWAEAAPAGVEADESLEAAVLPGRANPAERVERIDRPSRGRWETALGGEAAAGLLGLWGLLAGVRLGRLAWQYRCLRGLKRAGKAAPAEWQGRFEALGRELNLRRATVLRVCSESAAPLAVGFRHPAILLPRSLVEGLAGGELDAGAESVLRHELGHIQRGDDWTNLIEQTLKAIFFFHPGIWLISRRLTAEREIACDDYALAGNPAPRAYALFLAEFACRTRRRAASAAPAAWSHKSQLKERINMILDTKRNNSPVPARVRAGILTMGAAAAAALSLWAGPRLVLASDPDEAAASEAATIVAQAAPAAENQFGVNAVEGGGAGTTGPRIKPAQSVNPAPPAAPVVVVHPTPRPVPAAVIENGQPRVILGGLNNLTLAPTPLPPPAPEPLAAPAPVIVKPSRAKSGEDRSMERRLERLEKLVERLVSEDRSASQRKGVADPNLLAPNKPGAFLYFSESSPSANRVEARKELKKTKEVAKAGKDANPYAGGDLFGSHAEHEHEHDLKHDLHNSREEIRELERSAKNMERAQRDAHRRATDARLLLELDVQTKESDARRRVLEAQRRALEKQMEAIEEQLDRLEEEQDQLEAEAEKRRNERDDGRREKSSSDQKIEVEKRTVIR